MCMDRILNVNFDVDSVRSSSTISVTSPRVVLDACTVSKLFAHHAALADRHGNAVQCLPECDSPGCGGGAESLHCLQGVAVSTSICVGPHRFAV